MANSHGNLKRNNFAGSQQLTLPPGMRPSGAQGVPGCSHILNDEKNPGKRGPEFDVALCHRTQVDSGRRFQGLNNLFTTCGANYVHRTNNCASMQRILESFALHDSANPQNAEGEVARTCGYSESRNYLKKWSQL